MRIRCIKGWHQDDVVFVKGEEFQLNEGSVFDFGMVEFIGDTVDSWNYNQSFDFTGDLLAEHFEVV